MEMLLPDMKVRYYRNVYNDCIDEWDVRETHVE